MFLEEEGSAEDQLSRNCEEGDIEAHDHGKHCTMSLIPVM